MTQYRVMKTFVVGLGSTGTRICEALAERIDGELGNLKRAPWVEFLCIETDAAMSSRFNGTDDFRTLSIRAEQYSDIITNPQNYNQSIALERWADIETLRMLPSGSVDSGAGNIRMVGRLALLYPDNYTDIKNALVSRLANLRNLTVSNATDALNTDAVGHENEVSFATTNGIRVIVAGTLLGGTCSGTVSDFGILLQTLTQKEERVLGMFTIPHPQYSIALDPNAELRKTNAYHAIQELNQYLNYTDRERYKGIKYPDKNFDEQVLEPDETPYDLVYLLRSRENTKADETKLNSAIADRVFLNVFVPDVDPMATVVDGGIIPPKDGRAFAFATFGLSTIEYPVRRIIEACKLRILRDAFSKWKDRDSDKKLEDQLDDVGLTEENLTELLLRDEGGAPIRPRLEAKAREVREAARRGDLVLARKALEELRGAFERDKSEGFRGIVPRTVERNRSRAADEVLSSFAGQIRSKLLDFDIGVSPLLELMNGVQERTGRLRGWEPGEVNSSAAGAQLDRIEGVARNALIGAFMLRGKAIRQLLQPLDRALRDEMNGRLNRLAKSALIDQGSGQRIERGVLSAVDTETGQIRRRLQNLKTRLDTQTARWTNEISDLEKQDTSINGLSLFESAPNGTVEKEFRKVMVDGSTDRTCAEIIRSWQSISDAVLPSDNQPDWLIQPHNPAQGVFNRREINELEQLAVLPFRHLADPSTKDIATRLREAQTASFDPAQAAMGAAEAARVFLPVQENLGQPDPMSPLPKRKVLLGSSIPEDLQGWLQRWRSTPPPATAKTISNPFRIVMLEEWYKFSLKGSLDVTQSLANAKSDLFPTFFTRKRSDIDWTPISDSEVGRLREAEELVIFGVLHGVLRPQRGNLVLEWPEGVGEPSDPTRRARRLPLDINKAARMLAFSKQTDEGQNLNTVLTTLGNRISNFRSQEFDQKRDRQSEANEDYVRFLQKQLLEGEGHAILGWDSQKVTRLVLSYCRRDPELIRALYRVFVPDQADVQSLFKRAGESRPKGNGFFEKDGYYCKVCGGLVGYSYEVAIDNALQCSYYPDDPLHPFGREWDPFAVQGQARSALTSAARN